MTPLRCVAVLWTLALGGCVAFDAHSGDHAAAWHAAQVVRIGQAGELAASADTDCGAEGGPSARYAVVRYRNGGVHTRSLGTGRLPAGTELKVGDAVYVNVLDCSAPLMTQAQKSAGALR